MDNLTMQELKNLVESMKGQKAQIDNTFSRICEILDEVDFDSIEAPLVKTDWERNGIKGRVKKVTYYNCPIDKGEATGEKQYLCVTEYNSKGELISVSGELYIEPGANEFPYRGVYVKTDGMKVVHEYFEDDVEISYLDSEGLNEKFIYTYSEGNLVREVYFNNGKKDHVIYYKNGEYRKERYYNNMPSSYPSYLYMGKCIGCKIVNSGDYLPSSEKQRPNSSISRYEYYENDLLKHHYQDGELSYSFRYKYDDFGNVVEKRTYNGPSKQLYKIETREYEYF